MDEKTKIRKKNMKLFPICRTLGWDFIFFYTINFLFLTQVKNINPADIVLTDAFFYSLFGIVTQIPATFIIKFLGRRNSTILGNVLNCIYVTIILSCNSVYDLILAEFICSLAFAIKESSEPALLNASIPISKSRGEIFARINQKGLSGYYVVNSISTLLAGFLYEINSYLPILISLGIQIIVTMLSVLYKEPIEKKQQRLNEPKESLKDIKESLYFILKSERVKALIVFVATIGGIFSILTTYEVSLLEDLNISAKYIGILFAILGIISAKASKMQEKFHNKYKNTSLKKLGLGVTISCLIAGVATIYINKIGINMVLIIIVIAYIVKYICSGIYYPLIEKYLSNFANKDIDTKIFTARNFSKSVSGAVAGIIASFLLNRMNTAYCMAIIGMIFTILMILSIMYMKNRVGLLPENYSKEERKYDDIKNL